ncbi:jg21697 [Pararge aegeria aegeria]|uniref:Jg21697 protein n=1 Tax=Pararge aegeria aegeria TaxID=348720 RepID=A0A8S4SQH3_9NEOP|nr:jg21697 [Pararge aegeria aegeria]
MFIDERLTAITPDETGENGSWMSIPDPSGADQKRRCEALRTRPRYIDHADPYGASRFDGEKARGELDQIVLEHTLRNKSYRIPNRLSTPLNGRVCP